MKDPIVERMGDKLWVYHNQETYVVESDTSKRRRKASDEVANPKEIKSPMPGKITQMQAKVGDKVTKGQVLIVMEAMKMEYNLKAAAAGEIKSIHAKIGDQVAVGVLLCELAID